MEFMKYSVNSWSFWILKVTQKKIESHGLALKPVLNLSFLDWLWILGSFCISKAYQVLIYPSLSVCRWWISVSGLFLHKSSFIPNSIQFVQCARRYDATLKLRQIFVVSSFKSIFQQQAPKLQKIWQRQNETWPRKYV